MKERFFVKKFPSRKVTTISSEKVFNIVDVIETKEDNSTKKNKKNKSKDNMDMKEKINQVEATLISMEPEVKVVKKDKGLIERTESSKIVLTEDNRQLLGD